MAIYIEIEGIEGNITAKGYEKMIEISSFNWSVGRDISQSAGRMANREASRHSVSEIPGCVAPMTLEGQWLTR